jgi:hypothetical protein
MLKIFTRKGKKPDYASLKEQVFSVITTYVAIRGLHSLLRPEMATVMLKGFEAFLTQDPARIENPELYRRETQSNEKRLATRTRGY